jgi:hypothetical protein
VRVEFSGLYLNPMLIVSAKSAYWFTCPLRTVPMRSRATRDWRR